MSESEERYDEETGTVWVYYDFDDPETLVPNGELREWMAAVQKGEAEDGRDIEAVNYVFSDEASAEYNHQALAYGSINTYVGDLEDCEEYEPPEGTPEFDTKEDFGIE